MHGSAILIVAVLLGSQGSAFAQQRRDGGIETNRLRINLKRAVVFGGTVVAPGTYLIGLSDAGMSLIIETNMFTAATVPVQRSSAAVAVSTPQVKVITRGQTLEVRIALQNTRIVARGTVLPDKADLPPVDYENKDERDLDLAAGANTNDKDLLAASLNRYVPSVSHCADAALRNHWPSDDPKFIRCLCPIVEKWRLPKVKVALRAHRILVAKRAGMSLSVAVDGHTYDCRVWVGPTSPELRENEPPPAPVTIVPATAEALPGLAPIDGEPEKAQP